MSVSIAIATFFAAAKRPAVVVLVNLEVLGVELQRNAGLARERLLQSADEIQIERIAEGVGLGFVGTNLAHPTMVGGMAAGAVLEQALKDVTQRELPDASHALGR